VIMSLYQMQKFLFDINRDRDLQAVFRADRAAVLSAARSALRSRQEISA